MDKFTQRCLILAGMLTYLLLLSMVLISFLRGDLPSAALLQLFGVVIGPVFTIVGARMGVAFHISGQNQARTGGTNGSSSSI